MPFSTATLDSWDTLPDYAKPGHGWLYRGQRVAGWTLQTSLERCCDQRGLEPASRRTVEDRLCREFRRAYHQYGMHVPPKSSGLEWLALMQHHGAPTRLLDFSYSIYVGLYFAVEKADADSALFRIHGPWALRESITLLEKAGNSEASRLNAPYHEQDDKIFDKILLKPPVTTLCACPQTPFRLNERLRIQMGTFMVPGRIDSSFEENLKALPGHDKAENVLKLMIPSSLRDQALRQLFDMGLSRRTLFPGLDGYAQSLGVYTPAFDPIKWT